MKTLQFRFYIQIAIHIHTQTYTEITDKNENHHPKCCYTFVTYPKDIHSATTLCLGAFCVMYSRNAHFSLYTYIYSHLYVWCSFEYDCVFVVLN